jgi:hypothetical protein
MANPHPLIAKFNALLGTSDLRNVIQTNAEQIKDLEDIITAVNAALNNNDSKTITLPKSKTAMKKIVKANRKNARKTAERPLNSFIAFRSYYSPVFSGHQQKDISGFLNIIWKEELHGAKWTIIAKAYSTIRDSVGKLNAPLRIFLNIVCPYINVPALPPCLLMTWLIMLLAMGTLLPSPVSCFHQI